MNLDTGALARHIRKNFFSFESARDLAPPDAVIRLLEMALLLQIQDRQQEQADRGYGQQGRLQPVEEA
jgi:hypothetical protein